MFFSYGYHLGDFLLLFMCPTVNGTFHHFLIWQNGWPISLYYYWFSDIFVIFWDSFNLFHIPLMFPSSRDQILIVLKVFRCTNLGETILDLQMYYKWKSNFPYWMVSSKILVILSVSVKFCQKRLNFSNSKY